MKHFFSWLLRHCLLPIFTAPYTQSYFSLNAKSHTGIHKCFFPRDQADVQNCHQRSSVLQRERKWDQMLNVGILRSAMEGNPCIRTEVYLPVQSVVHCYAYTRNPQNSTVRQSHELQYTEDLRILDHPQEKAKCCHWKFKAAELGQDHLFYMFIQFLQPGILEQPFEVKLKPHLIKLNSLANQIHFPKNNTSKVAIIQEFLGICSPTVHCPYEDLGQ